MWARPQRRYRLLERRRVVVLRRAPVDRERVPVERARVPVERDFVALLRRVPVVVLRRVPVERDFVALLRRVPVVVLRRVPAERDRVEVLRPAEPRDDRAEARPPRAPAVFTFMRPPVFVRDELERDRVEVLRLRAVELRPDVLRLRVPVARDFVEPLRPRDDDDVFRLEVLRPDVFRPDVLRLRVPLLFRGELVPERLRPLLVERFRPDVEPDRVLLAPRPRDDADRARLEPTPCRLREPDPPSSSPESDDSSSSPSSPSSFFATPTAAGTATPRAAPATTFCVVDIPSSSVSPFSS